MDDDFLSHNKLVKMHIDDSLKNGRRDDRGKEGSAQSFTPKIESTDGGKMILRLPHNKLTNHKPKLSGYQIERPKNIVSEEEYSATLSDIISRDYFNHGNSASSSKSNLGLDQYQANFTSEDNDSFNSVLEQQVNKQRGQHSWLWESNKVDGSHVKKVKQIMNRQNNKLLTDLAFAESQSAAEKSGLIDQRPTILNSNSKRDSNPRNALMFPAEGHGRVNKVNQEAKIIVRENTRIKSTTSTSIPPTIPSPLTGLTPPTVKTYGYVTENSFSFELPVQSKRDDFHQTLLAKNVNSRKKEKSKVELSYNSKSGRISKTPLSTPGQKMNTPLSPAASRLMSRMGKTKLSNFNLTPKRKRQ